MTDPLLWRRIGAAMLIFPLLAGCAVGPDYAAPSLTVPVRWSEKSESPPLSAPTLAQWWRRLNDPILNQLIVEAVHGNLDVTAAKARIREARGYRAQAVGALFPSVTGTGSATQNQSGATSVVGSDGVGVTVYNQFQAGFDAAWELDIFGGNRRALEAASYGVDAAEDDLRLSLLTLVGDIAANYVDARGYQARSALARRTAGSQRNTAALTQKKFDAGSAAAVDVAKASAQAAATEANIPGFNASFAQAVHRIGVLLGRDPVAVARRLEANVAIPSAIPRPRLPLPKGIPADVLVMRPDVRKAERQLAQYTAKIGQAEAALYPSVSLTGSVSTTGLKIGDLGKSSSIGWSIGPTLSVPIFNGGKLRAGVQIAQAQRDQYDAALRAAVLSALEDVENAIVSLAQERIRTGSLAEAARRYREASRLSHALYDTGSSSFLDVLDAERSQYSAEDTLLQSSVSVAKDYIALAKALGGGWDGAIDSAVPAVADGYAAPHIVAER
jgi:multidrug efflux system outer membrane protein